MRGVLPYVTEDYAPHTGQGAQDSAQSEQGRDGGRDQDCSASAARDAHFLPRGRFPDVLVGCGVRSFTGGVSEVRPHCHQRRGLVRSCRKPLPYLGGASAPPPLPRAPHPPPEKGLRGSHDYATTSLFFTEFSRPF